MGPVWGAKECTKVSVGKPEVKERPRRKLEDNIKKNLENLDGVVWNGLIWFWTGGLGDLL
jgi:hypothetical protein